MKEVKAIKNGDSVFPKILAKDREKSAKRTLYVFAILGIYGGILSIAVGFLSTIVHSLIPTDTIFNYLATILIILGIPLMILGGHFLDLAIEKGKK